MSEFKKMCYTEVTLRTGTLVTLYLSLILLLPSPLIEIAGMSIIRQEQVKSEKIYIALLIIGEVICIHICIAGLYGVYEKKSGFLIPYLILLGSVVLVLVIASVYFLMSNHIFCVMLIIPASIAFCCWLVVLKHYGEMEIMKAGFSLMV